MARRRQTLFGAFAVLFLIAGCASQQAETPGAPDSDTRYSGPLPQSDLAVPDVTYIEVQTGDPSDDGASPATRGPQFTGSTVLPPSSPPRSQFGPPITVDPGVAGPTSSAFGASTTPGQPGAPEQTTPPDSRTSLPLGPTTTLDYTDFRCAAKATLFSGERTGSARRIKVSVIVSTKDVPMVWVETSWDEEVRRQAIALNPEARMDFLLYAAGTDWPRVRVFAASDFRATSQMCSS